MQKSFIRKFLGSKVIWLVICLVSGFVLGALLLGLFVSSVQFPIMTILHIVLDKSFGIGWLENIPRNEELIIWNIRLPRVLLALCVGASLAFAGAAFQGLLRNPLADPYTIGVSSGAALGAVLVIFFQFTIIGLGSFTLPVVAIGSGFITLAIVFGLVRLSSRGLAIETIILAGIIVGCVYRIHYIASHLARRSGCNDTNHVLVIRQCWDEGMESCSACHPLHDCRFDYFTHALS